MFSGRGAIAERAGSKPVLYELGMADDLEPVQMTITAVRPVSGRAIFAFVDVELVIAGVALTIHGLQARHAKPHGTSVHLPTYRAEANTPKLAITLPPELFGRLGDLVLEDLIARGVAKPRVTPPT